VSRLGNISTTSVATSIACSGIYGKEGDDPKRSILSQATFYPGKAFIYFFRKLGHGRERKGGCRWPVGAGVESPPTTGRTDIPTDVRREPRLWHRNETALRKCHDAARLRSREKQMKRRNPVSASQNRAIELDVQPSSGMALSRMPPEQKGAYSPHSSHIMVFYGLLLL
jgi:hypothetical protein